jgi:vacuolar-type H+-ATPase subunit E/Vma4
MRPIEEGIQALSHAVESEARGEAEQILADARAKADATRQRAQEQASAQRAEIMKRAQAEASRIRGQAIATTQLKARTVQLEQREKLLNNTFQAAQQKIAGIQQWKDYPLIARSLLRESLQRLGAPSARIRTDAKTRQVLTDDVAAAIGKELGVQVQFGEPLQAGAGVVVETLDQHRQYDNTLETRASRLQNTLRSRVYHLLMGESI